MKKRLLSLLLAVILIVSILPVSAFARQHGGVTTTRYSVNVTAQPVEGGTVTGGGQYAYDSNATVTATPNSGYRFVEWREYYGMGNPMKVSGDASYTFKVKGHRNLVAVFEPIPTAVVQFTKTGINDDPLAGATFQLKEWVMYGDAETYTATSDENGIVKFEVTKSGKYVLSETKVPDGYKDYEGKHYFLVDVNGKTPREQVKYSEERNGNYGYYEGLLVIENTAKYKLNYDANDGSGAPAAQLNTTRSFTVSTTVPTRDGYEFLGWKYGDATYFGGDTFKLGSDKNEATLKAVWRSATTTVTATKVWNAPQGTNLPNNVKVYLMANGNKVDGSGRELGYHRGHHSGYFDWDCEWNNLPLKDNSGNPIVYTVGEEDVEGYTTSITNNGNDFTVTNTKLCNIAVDAYPAAGGTVSGGGQYAYNSEATVTATPNSGYEFVEWRAYYGMGNPMKVSGDASYTFKVERDRYLVAVFERNTATITFENEDGTVLQSGEVAYGETPVYAGETPTKATTAEYTYTFAGWDADLVPVTGPATYTATYTSTANEYTITYKDGEDILDTGTYAYGATVAAIADPSKTGYTFTEWNPAVPATMPAENVIVYAQWTVNKYKINYEGMDGASFGEGVTAPVEYVYDTAVTIPVPAKTGYTFLGWTVNSGEEVTEELTLAAKTYTADITLEAQWQINTYTVTFVNEDGTTVLGEGTYDYGTLAENIVKPADPTKKATVQYTYTFAGWTPAIATVTGDATYKATYTATLNKYTVTYTDGVDGYVAFKDQKFTVDYGTKTPEFVGTPRRIDHTFTGWKPVVAPTVTGDVTYVAQWRYSAVPVVVVAGLNTEDHVAYIVGRGDGTFDPEANVTRAEAAVMFYRLMSDNYRTIYWDDECSYTDVKDDAWYTVAIATLEKAGAIDDTVAGGKFRPNDPITRAELAVMASHFTSVGGRIPGAKFTDVYTNHWAYREISYVQFAGWIEGYNGYFRPEDNLTRAECVSIINRMLQRGAEEGDMLSGMITFKDNMNPIKWYYEAIQEAANSHKYTRTGKVLTGEKYIAEKWTSLKPSPDWKSLEEKWAEDAKK